MSTQKALNVDSPQLLLSFRFNNPVNSNSAVLEMGKLKLTTPNENILYSATSGLPKYQNLASSKIRRKGRIPSCSQAGIANYVVKTNPIWLPNTQGVNGNFYPISPFVVSVQGNTRSDLGIHRDTNVAGSAGCLVITLEDHWKQFEAKMKSLASNNIMSIPLIVF